MSKEETGHHEEKKHGHGHGEGGMRSNTTV
jgi:hypothetical protein